jgi:hypothetical protein
MFKRGLSPFVIIIGIIVSLISLPAPSGAQWTEIGAAVCTEQSDQSEVCTVTDGEGGAFIAWSDSRSGSYLIYVQHIDAAGFSTWPADGFTVSSVGTSQVEPRLAFAGDGGVVVAWRSLNSDYDIYAQKLDSAGNKLWGADGVLVCAESVSQTTLRMCPDHAGGAVIVWQDTRVGSQQVYAMRVDAWGTMLWTAGGRSVTYAAGGIWSFLEIASDGFGGFYGTWIDATGYDIWAEWIHPNGNKMWGSAAGISVYLDANNHWQPKIIADGGGGAIVSWEDNRAADTHIYAQKIATNGAIAWNSSGVQVCGSPNHKYGIALASDGATGAIVTWVDSRGSADNIYAQRIDGAGIAQWTTDGIAVCPGAGDQYFSVVASDGAGGAILTWDDMRTFSSFDIYAARLDAAGNTVWDSGCVPVSDGPFDQSYPQMASDGFGNTIFAYVDNRDLNEADIYAQRIGRYGKWGFPAPGIVSVRDVPGDQGGQVNISWNASRLDIWPENEISYYSIWRAIDEETALAMLGPAGILALEEGGLSSDPSSLEVRRTLFAGEPYYWTEVDQVPSSEFTDHYARLVSTLFDSTATSVEHHYFQIVAHGLDPSHHWISGIDSGYSVDNLAPCAPLALAGEQSFAPAGLELTWTPNMEPDVDCYRIYRGTDPGFDPGTGNLLAEQCDTLLLDEGWDWDSEFCYKVAAVDVHGNESGYAVLCMDQVTGDDPMPLPDATFLAQNYPNPFNPITTIAFSIKESGHVSLRIYDAAGRLVTTLVNESRPAGSYSTEWNGRGAEVTPAASGVYFYRLITNEFEETRKMILLR